MKEGVIRECVNYCVNVGLFDKDIYDSYRVLTSSGIQERYFSVVAKRRVHDMSRLPYLLVSATEIGVSATEMQSKIISASETGVSVTETDVHVTVTGISEAETPLNKGDKKESHYCMEWYQGSDFHCPDCQKGGSAMMPLERGRMPFVTKRRRISHKFGIVG